MAAGPDPHPPPGSSSGARRLSAGSRSRVWLLDGPAGRVVVKLAALAAVVREAEALSRVAALGVAPRVVAAGDGVLVTGALAGATAPAAEWGAHRARALGALLARLHGAGPAPAGTYDGWDRPEADLGAYRARRAAGRAAPPAPLGDEGFTWLHGDLWSGNVVWEGARPALVDWEVARPGDPAEDLAYLAAMDDLDPATLRALLDGYAPARRESVEAAVAWWRPLLAAECAAWFAAEGDHDRAGGLRARAGACWSAG
ncbi:MAG: aminoglycoside phosphotransferase family protein [Miltoncostaeaceae bacterium]